MKKLLLVTDAWTPQVNGVVRVAQALIPLIEAQGVEVVVVEPGQFRTVALPFYPEIRLALCSRRRMREILEETQPDAIILMTEGPLGWAARAVCRAQKIPFTTWYHSHYQLYVDVRLRGLLGPINALMRRFHNAATQMIVSTETLKETLSADGFAHVVVVPLGVDVELFKRNSAPPLPALPQPVFIYFGRLAPEKSPEEFLALDLPGTKLVVGDGPLRKKLEKQYGDKNIFVGYKHGQELVDYLSLADVFIFPSRTETFGLVALEAFACGVRVAAHDVMGPRDVITSGVDGVLSDDLQSAALACLDLSRDACRKKAEQYSWSRSADAFIQVLFPSYF